MPCVLVIQSVECVAISSSSQFTPLLPTSYPVYFSTFAQLIFYIPSSQLVKILEVPV